MLRKKSVVLSSFLNSMVDNLIRTICRSCVYFHDAFSDLPFCAYESALSNEYLDMEVDWIPGMEGICLKDLPEFTRYSKPDDPAFKFLLETA
ncbi:hypothetical protein L1987_30615 [Smallanthus sonchifolius]|uniref:Uncharacterized protein n=1 Tax=Smallanthus sonchifolius TaxID=185202 RepID=A0ACB9I453_9ASTR|nr:hypothetical protein L1987_30615 [Smallanthus sonchifolius]